MCELVWCEGRDDGSGERKLRMEWVVFVTLVVGVISVQSTSSCEI